jgi:hypothetical protein
MIIKESITIHAPLAAVWNTLTDISRWNEWNTVLTNCSDAGTACLSPDARCTWCIRPFVFSVYFTPVIEELVPHERIVWRARKFGIAARHEFFFTQEGGSVRVESKEAFAKSAPLYFIAILFRFKLKALTRTFLSDVKKAAEASASSQNGATQEKKEHA